LPYSEVEILTESNKYNEHILTRLRTIWGVSIINLKESFGIEKATYFQNNIERYIITGLIKQHNGIYYLTESGMFVSDEIMANLMFI